MSMRTEKGGALLTVLWLSAALAAIAVSVSTSVRSETDRVASAADGLRAWYLATGSVERGIQWMLWGDSVRNPDGSPRWSPNLPRLNLRFPSGDAVVELIPESAKLNINGANRDELVRVIQVVSGDPEKAQQIADAIIDWRQPTASPTVFDQYYFSLAPTFHARHASFEEIEELLLVRGMTPELFYGNYLPDEGGRLYSSGGLRECFSVWGGGGPFDVNTASPALMEAVGVSRAGVDAIVARRRVRPFHDMDEVLQLGFSTPRIGVGGNLIWTLRAAARLRRPDGSYSEVGRTASATIKLLDRVRDGLMPAHVMRWYDDAWSQNTVMPSAEVLP
jgi:general secretion pathway protein K